MEIILIEMRNKQQYITISVTFLLGLFKAMLELFDSKKIHSNPDIRSEQLQCLASAVSLAFCGFLFMWTDHLTSHTQSEVPRQIMPILQKSSISLLRNISFPDSNYIYYNHSHPLPSPVPLHRH